MAKNVSITEDGNSKTIENAARIRTSLIGGGTCDWIPKDDVPLQKLTVTEDGTYRPEQNYHGFSQVTARGIGNVIEGELIEKTITKNGTYNIKDEIGNPYGYSKIIVNVDTSGDSGGGDSGGGGGGGITGKDEDGNDTMAETDEDGNIVMTALPTEIKVIIPPTKLEYNRYEEIDYSGISVYAYISKAVHWLGTTTTAISEGSTNSTVVIDGKSISISVGDGVTYSPAPAVTYYLVWDGAKWVKLNNYSAEKAPWISNDYSTGKIPFEELIFPIKRANYVEGVILKKETKKISDMIDDAINIIPSSSAGVSGMFKLWHCYYVRPNSQSTIHWEYQSGSYYKNANVSVNNGGKIILYDVKDVEYVSEFTRRRARELQLGFLVAWDGEINYNSIRDIIEINEEENGDTERGYQGEGTAYSYSIRHGSLGVDLLLNSSVSSYTHNNKTVNYINRHIVVASTSAQGSHIGETSPTISFEDMNFDYSINGPLYNSSELGDLRQVAWTMVFGYDEIVERIYSISLPVQWKRPGDGKILETTFTAWMKDDGSEAPQGGNG